MKHEYGTQGLSSIHHWFFPTKPARHECRTRQHTTNSLTTCGCGAWTTASPNLLLVIQTTETGRVAGNEPMETPGAA